MPDSQRKQVHWCILFFPPLSHFFPAGSAELEPVPQLSNCVRMTDDLLALCDGLVTNALLLLVPFIKLLFKKKPKKQKWNQRLSSTRGHCRTSNALHDAQMYLACPGEESKSYLYLSLISFSSLQPRGLSRTCSSQPGTLEPGSSRWYRRVCKQSSVC